jgi:hypothetical protein
MNNLIFLILTLVLLGCITIQDSDKKCFAVADAYTATEKEKRYKSIDDFIVAFARHLPPKLSTELEKEYLKSSKKKAEHIGLYNWNKECIKQLDSQPTGDAVYYKEARKAASSALSSFNRRISGYYSPTESKVFAERTGGKHLCGNFLHIFMSRFQEDNTNCIFYEGINNLIAVQSTSKGIIARSWRESPYPGTIKYVYISKGNTIDNNVVDGATVPNGYFEYNGLYNYNSILGAESTIYSFKRITNPNLFKDIDFYN